MTPIQRARALPRRTRLAVILGVAAVVVLIALLVPPVPQDPAYHDFADGRAFLGIANFGDVASNLPFLLIGGLGLAVFLRGRPELGGRHDPLRWPFLVYFAGVGLVAVGSAYYHLNPTNETLFWDRLPMTIAFMGLFSAFIVERIDERIGTVLLPLLLAAGIASVVYWSMTEAAGRGDLRPYAIVQFFPMLAIPLICVFFPSRRLDGRALALMAAFYGLAKVFEHFDAGVFALLGETVSGHSLKHLAAAAAATMALPMLKWPGAPASDSVA